MSKWQQLLGWTPCGPQSSIEPELDAGADIIDATGPAAAVNLSNEASTAFRKVREEM